MNHIRLLPESLANQIAAGEVVQRPSSVVKELLENAVDAGSTNIQLIVKEAGKILIQVVDNGTGMSETDARMCFERHATSKISKTEDLFAIHTFGFRGEAMASIAAVAQVLLKAKRKTDETGTTIQIEGSKVKLQKPTAMSDGTNVSVKNLFFNVPARRNFLKSNAVELKHILDEFQRVALSNPQINMAFYQDGKEIYVLKFGKLAKRITSLFGKNYQGQIIKCSEEVPQVKIQGYIGKPESAKKTRGEQFFFVNNRFIKHPYLHHAVMYAYENLLAQGYFPFYAIFIEIDPVHIDFNVHPTKTEIKFDDERTIYAVVCAAVRQAIASHGLAPSIDFNFNVNFGKDKEKQRTYTKGMVSVEGKRISDNTPGKSSKCSPIEREIDRQQQSNQRHWERLYVENPENFNPTTISQTQQNKRTVNIEENTTTQKVHIVSSAANTIADYESFDGEMALQERKAIQIRNKYIACPVRSGLMIIDREAAMERIFYERFTQQLKTGKTNAQKLLFPIKVALNPSDFVLIVAVKEELKTLGLIFETTDKHEVIISAVPHSLEKSDEKELLEGFIEQLKFYQLDAQNNAKYQSARALAKRAATKAKRLLEKQEINTVIEELLSCANPNYTPDGKKTLSIMSMESIGELFAN